MEIILQLHNLRQELSENHATTGHKNMMYIYLYKYNHVVSTAFKVRKSMNRLQMEAK